MSKAIKDQLDKLGNPPTDDGKRQKKELEDAQVQCQMEEAMSFFDERRTYLTDKEADIRAQNALIKKAIDVLDKLSREARGTIGHEASAWLIPCYFYSDDLNAAWERYGRVIGDASPNSGTAKRLARFFVLQIFERDNLPPGILKMNEKALNVIRTRATDWMKDYPAHLKSPEGYGVQFALAKALAGLANQMGVPAQEKKIMLDQSKALCRGVEHGESEWTTKARRLKLGIMVEEKTFERPIDKLATFDDSFVRAQFEASQIEEEAKKHKGDPAALKKAHDEHYGNVITALTQALKLVDKPPKPPEKEVLVARATLAYAYMTLGGRDNIAKTIDSGEELARIKTRPPESAKGAIYALQAMAQILAEGERSGFGPNELKAYKDRFINLAEFAKKSWPTENPGDVARHQLGLMYIRDADYPMAVKELASIKPGYSGAIHANFQLAMAALGADQAGAKPAAGDPDNRPFKERAQVALETMPELPDNADAGTNYTYLMAKIKLGQILYVAKRYDDLEKLAAPLKEQVAKMDKADLPTPDVHEEMLTGFGTLVLYAKFAKASEAYKAGKLADVNVLLDPIVDQALKDELPEFKKNAELRWGMLGLALRAAIQDGKLDKANLVIQTIQKLSAGEANSENETKTLLTLSGLINEQMREVKKKNMPELVAKTQMGFAQLLEGMLKERKDKLKDKPQLAYVLAKCYGSLDKHKEAAELVQNIAEPPAGADAKAVTLYQQSRIEHARQLRQDKQFEAAQKELDAIGATDWGKKNLELRKEIIFWEQDKELYGKAATAWNSLIKQIVPLINQPGMREQYFDCYFNLTFCVAKSAEKQTEAATKTKLFKQSASLLIGLEKQYEDRGGDEWKVRYQELLDTMPELKAEYDTMKGASTPK